MRAIDILEATLGSDHQAVAFVLNTQAEVLSRQVRPEAVLQTILASSC